MLYGTSFVIFNCDVSLFWYDDLQRLVNERDEPEMIDRRSSAAASASTIDVDISHHLLSDNSIGPDDIPVSQQSTHRVYTTPIAAEEVCHQ